MKIGKRWIAYVVAAAIGLLIAAAVLASRRFWALTEPAEILAALCDAFFVPGIIYLSVGVLLYVSNEGFFDIFAYGGHSLLLLFTPFRKPENQEHYYEYKQARAERRKQPKPVLLVIGAVFVLLAGVCLIMMP